MFVSYLPNVVIDILKYGSSASEKGEVVIDKVAG